MLPGGGMDDYLSKPIQPDRLGAAIARWAHREAGAEPEPSVGENEHVAPVAPAAPAAPFDPAVLLGLLGGDKEAANEIIAEYVADAPRQVAALHEGRGGDDADAVRRQAHTLKGTSANVGAAALRAAAYDVERAAAAGDFEAARGLADRLDVELQRLQDYFAGGDDGA